MNYKLEKNELENKVTITFNFSQEEFEQAIKNTNKEDRNQAIQEAVDSLISSSYVETVNKEELKVVSYPTLTPNDVTEGFSYTAVVYVYPSITLIKYKGLNIAKEEASVTDEEVKEEVNRLVEAKATLVNVDRAIIEGDTVIFDFKGKLNGEEFQGGSATNYSLVIGSKMFIPGFEDQMIGLKVNEEKTLKLRFPDNYTADLAGKDVDFEVKIHEIKESSPAVLNDELAASLGYENVSDVASLFKHVKQQILSFRNKKAEDEVFEKIMKTLIELNPVNIPSCMVENEVQERIDAISKQAEQYKIPVEVLLQYSGMSSMEEFKSKYTKLALEKIHQEIILAKVAEVENVDLSEQEIEEYYQTIANNKNVKVEEVKERFPVEQYKYSFIIDKTLKYLIDVNKA